MGRLPTALVGLTTLGQAQSVGSPPKRLAAELAHTANDIGATLQGLAEHTHDGGHFY